MLCPADVKSGMVVKSKVWNKSGPKGRKVGRIW